MEGLMAIGFGALLVSPLLLAGIVEFLVQWIEGRG